ncbi:MAG: T9SS type A sorting domain-containing protein [Cryomorphaceae bacterium]|nr:T9SS type A sorting domain-containing protein [Cryomorphaceae bacterium]
MRNRLLLIAVLLGFTMHTRGQAIIDTILFENFDTIPISGNTFNVPASGQTLPPSVHWKVFDSIPLAPSQPNSYRSVAGPNAGTSFWDSDILDFTGKNFVLLEFKQIAKIHGTDNGRIFISTDSGVTFTQVTCTNSQYLGASTNFCGTNYFNEMNYPIWSGPTTNISNISYPSNNWWQEEIFDITSLVANESAVVIRFSHGFPAVSQFMNIPPAMPGWFIDDVFAIGATCNLQPPAINFTLTPPVNYNNRPEGFQPCEGKYTIALEATDNSAVDSVELFYRINFGPWQRKNMLNPFGDRYVDTIPFVFTDDTIQYYVVAWDDQCPNSTRRPSDTTQYYQFRIGEQPPIKCGTWYNCGMVNVPFIQDVLPWVVDFQHPEWVPGTGPGAPGTQHRGDMPVSQGDKDWIVSPSLNSTGFAWSVRQGATPTNLTGPNVDNTLGNSSGKYVFAAATQGSGFSPTELTSHCVEVPADSCLYIEFFYYMYGDMVQELRLDIDTGATTAQWVTGVWTQTGQQQTGPNQPWRRAYIPLDDYNGKTLRFRWRATKLGSINRADIAIDDIRVDYASPTDMEATLLVSPLEEGCNFSANEPVSMIVRNIGCNTATNIPVAYNINGGPPVWDTIPGPLAQGDTTLFTFTQGANISAVGTYDIKGWTAIPGDGNTSNDTTNTISTVTVPVISTFPHILDFDGPGNNPGNGTFANAGTISTTDWERIPDPTAPGASGYAFMVGEGMTPTIATGPFTDVSGFGNYLYAEGNFGNAATNAVFESNCFDLSQMANPTFDFYYHGYHGQNTFDSLCVNILPTGSTTWITPPGGRITSFSQSDELDPWTYRRFDLSNWGTGNAKIRIVAYRRTGGDRCDMAIDNLAVYNQINQDAGIFNIQPPGLGLPLATSPMPTLHIRNFGSQTLTSIPVEVDITPLCGPNQGTPTTYTATATVNIAPGQTGTFQVPVASGITYPKGRFEICARTAITADNNTWNDEWCKYVTAFTVDTIPFIDNFDDCDHSSQGWFSQAGKQIWEVGTPTSGAASPPNAFFTNLTGPYYPGTSEYLRVPLLTGFDTIQGAQISFSQFMQSPTAHGGRLEILEAGNWLPLGSVNAANVGSNWHSHAPYGVAGTPLFPTGPAWVSNTNGWINSSYPLFDYNYSTTTLQMRFHWKSTTTPAPQAGWGIDNFEISIPPQNSAAPVAIRARDNLVFPLVDQDIYVTIENTGQKNLDSCKLRVSFDNANTWGNDYWIVFNPPLRFGQRREVIYPEELTNPAAGATYGICAVTSRPNNKEDNLPADDSMCDNVPVIPEFDLADDPNNEYCNNFEDPHAFNFVPVNGNFIPTITPTWQMGTPNQNPILGAYIGNNAWMTGLTTDYVPMDNSGLVTPVFIIDSLNTTYEMSFYHNFFTEKGHDGGNVEYSQDGGATWGVLGEWERNPDTSYSWYNEPFIFGLDVIKPGWTHNSNGWQRARLKFCFEVGGQTIFRFRFGSDNNIENAGWAIDDFCLREIQENCEYSVSSETYVIEDGLAIAPPAPNPAQGHTYIAYNLPRSGNMKVQVTNLLGQKLFEEIEMKPEGRSQTNFDVSTWRNGVYIITIEFEGKAYTSKLIVQK